MLEHIKFTYLIKKGGVKMEKKKYGYFIIIAMIFALSNIIFAQDVITVPNVYNGQAMGAINKFIVGDTLSDGSRAHPNAIYRLERGKIYFQDQTMDLNFNFTLVADDEDPNSPTRPPMVVRGVDDQGAYTRILYQCYNDNIKIKVKNIIFQGIPTDESIVSGNVYLFTLSGKNIRFEANNCVFNYWPGNVIENKGYGLENFTLILKNNIFRNNVGLEDAYSGYSYVGGGKVKQDSIIFHNNTFFNISAYIIYSKEYAGTFEFLHNTLFTSCKGSLRLPNLINAHFEDNLLYNYQTVAQDSAHWVSKHYAMVQIREINAEGLAEAGIASNEDRLVSYRNNVYGWDQRVKDFWSEYHLHEVPWMGPITDSLFTKYDNFIDENNLEANPGFDAAMTKAVLDKQLEWNAIYRTTKTGYADRIYAPNGKYFDLPWPLPEHLTYTNTNLQTYAQGGFPVGDLNWWGKVADWESWRVTGVRKDNGDNQIPNKYVLSQNYPNPFNPTTVINFSIPKTSKIELSVYNVLGQKVATLLNKELAAGSYKYDFNASNLTSGIYFYKLQTENYSQTKKMMLLK